MKAKISEVFKSIQGEGLFQGIEQVFVRFFGCNLNCRFCDTKLDSYREVTVSALLDEVNSFGNCHSVALTGGEPLLQIDFLKQLCQALKEKGKTVYLETNGTLYQNLPQIIDNLDIIAMDFKLSSSTGMADFCFEHREFLKVIQGKEIFVKAVIGKTTLIEDLRIALAIIKEVDKNIPLVLQPEHPYEQELQNKLDYFKKVSQDSNINVRVIPQLHKVLGVR